MMFRCSECNGEVIKKDGKLVCIKCGRTVEMNKSTEETKTIDLNDNTKNLNVLFG